MNLMNGEYRIGDVVLGNWTLVKLLGEGAYGKVYEAHREDFGTTYTAAIKVMTIPQSQSEVESARAEGMDDESVTSYFRSFVEDVVQEFALMSELKGTANVVSYEDHSVTPHTEGIGWDILIRMELLTPMLKHMTSHEMTRSDIIKLGIDMCKALELCQRFNIIHRDIKPENIFVSRTGDYKLGDFGVARTLEKTTGGLSKKGTYTYMAPEIYKDEKYGSTVDIYSLGIVLYRLLNNNRAPFLPEPPKPITHSERERALVRRISGEQLPLPANADGRLAEIVLKACAYDPKDRYSSPLLMRQELEAIQYHKADDEVIYGRSGKIDVDSRDYTKMGDDERTVYESRKPAPVPTDGDEDDEKTVYQAHQTNAEIPTATKDTKKGNKTGLIIGIAAVAILAVLAIFLLPKLGKGSSEPVDGQTPVSTVSDDGITLNNSFGESDSIAAAIHRYAQFLAADDYQTLMLHADGTVEAFINENDWGQGRTQSWSNVGGVAAGEYWSFGIQNDGHVLVSTTQDPSEYSNMASEVEKWENIVKLECSGGVESTIDGITTTMVMAYHTVGLKYDGTVVAAGESIYGECDVSSWSNIVDIAAGYRHTVGLKQDGTVVAVGSNENGQCDVADWTDIVSVTAGKYCTVGLRSDGTVVITGTHHDPRDPDAAAIANWKNITSIFADCDDGEDSDYVLAVDSNGKLYCSGANHSYATAFVKDCVKAVGSSWGYLAYLNDNGEVVAFSSDNDAIRWEKRIGSPIATGLMLPDSTVEIIPLDGSPSEEDDSQTVEQTVLTIPDYTPLPSPALTADPRTGFIPADTRGKTGLLSVLSYYVSDGYEIHNVAVEELDKDDPMYTIMSQQTSISFDWAEGSDIHKTLIATWKNSNFSTSEILAQERMMIPIWQKNMVKSSTITDNVNMSFPERPLQDTYVLFFALDQNLEKVAHVIVRVGFVTEPSVLVNEEWDHGTFQVVAPDQEHVNVSLTDDRIPAALLQAEGEPAPDSWTLRFWLGDRVHYDAVICPSNSASDESMLSEVFVSGPNELPPSIPGTIEMKDNSATLNLNVTGTEFYSIQDIRLVELLVKTGETEEEYHFATDLPK